MPRKGYLDDQIARALRASEQGARAAEVSKKFGITETTFYRWRRRFSSMVPSESKRLKQLHEENRRLKTIVADPTLDKTMGQAVCWEKQD